MSMQHGVYSLRILHRAWTRTVSDVWWRWAIDL